MVPHLRRIDTLRGISILLVLLHHFHLAYRLGPSLLFRNGNYGVTTFFVISGFLITSTSIRRFGSLQAIAAKQFYAFRFARIYPCLILVLIAVTVPGLAGVRYFASNRPVTFTLADLSVLTFWHNILMAHVGYFNYCLNTLWSLSVEEVFYSLFPVVCLWLRSELLLTGLWMITIIAGPIYRSWHAESDIQYLYANLSCFDSIAMGCCAAVWQRRGSIGKITARMIQITAAIGIVAVLFYASIGDNQVWGPTLLSVSVAVLLWSERTREPVNAKRINPLGWMGRHSYELYLFHIVVLAAMRNSVDRSALPKGYKLPWLAFFIAASALVAWAIARFYGGPANRWLRRALA